MTKSPAQMRAAIIRNLPRRTGRTLEQWVDVLRALDLETYWDRVVWLKETHGLGHVTAGIVASELERPDGFEPPSDDDLVAAQYAGPRAALRPIYERVVSVVQDLGADVELGRRKTYVSFIRHRQFGVIQAVTRTRVDVGLRLRGIEPTERLRPAGSFCAGQMSHRVGLMSVADLDDELREWIRIAYEQAG